MLVDNENTTDNNLTIPLLDENNLENSKMNNESNSINNSNSNSNSNNGSTNTSSTTTLSTNPLISIITLPMTVIIYILTNFQAFVYSSIQGNLTAEECQFVKSIPKETKVLQNDMDHVKDDQKNIGHDIDDLMRRVEILKEKRRKREEKYNHWMMEEKNDVGEQKEDVNIVTN
eukprot:76075_1